MSRDIALIGCGNWGSNIARELIQMNRLHTVIDPKFKVGKIFASTIDKTINLQNTNITKSFEEVLENENIKGVVIATPPNTHFEIAQKALEYNKHVFVEKPVCPASSEVDKLTEAAASTGKTLFGGHIMLFHPAIEKLLEIQEEKIGEINYFQSRRLNLGIIRTNETPIKSLAPHDVSLLLTFLPRSNVKVLTTKRRFTPFKTYDYSTTFFDYSPYKAFAKIEVGWWYPQKRREIVLVGTKGMAIYNDFKTENLKIYSPNIEIAQGENINLIDTEPEIIEIDKSKSPLQKELEYFLNLVDTDNNGDCHLSNGYFSKAVVRTLERMEDS